MFESLNFQLTSTTAALETAADRSDNGAPRQSATEGGWPPFSSLLGTRTGTAVARENSGGETVPESGKPVPPFDPLGGVGSLASSISEADAAAVKRQELQRIPDSDRNLELEVASLQPQMPISVTVPVVWPLSESIATAQNSALEAGAERRSSPDTAAMPLREIQASVSMMTQNLVVPTGVEPAASANLSGPIRDIQIRTSPLTTIASGSPADSAIELADMPRENAVGPLSRALEVLAPPQRSDSKVVGTSPLHSATTVHLPATISQFNNEASLYRAPALLESISTPVRDPAWGEMLGERVLVLTERQMKSAEIRLTPADLGPLRVRISVEDGATNVTFQVQHAVTREAIEQALPRLREMLADSGLSLGQTDVSEQDVAGGRPDREPASTAVMTDEPANEPLDSRLAERRNTVTASNLLDTFV